ncbi:MAG: carboxypeptidase regulatory-like domain-containing protein [Candidatus Krumholzibacteriia bacterium]
MRLEKAIRYGMVPVVLGGLVAFGGASGAQDGTGAIEGSVLFNVQLPEPERIRVTRNADVCGPHKVSQEFVVSKANKGLKNVVIRLSGDPAGEGAAEVTLDQKGCAYVPHVQVARRGAKLLVTNSDPTFHNVHAYHVQSEFKKPTLFNIAQPAGDAAAQAFVLDKTGVVEFNCDVHEWMKAFVVVHDNPYFSVTDESGHYAVERIPPGEYTLTVWHEGLGEFEQPVTVTAGETLRLDFPIEGDE